MWNGDQFQRAGQPVRPHPLAYVLAAILPLLLIMVLALPMGIVFAAKRFWLDRPPGPPSVHPSTPPRNPGSDGAGDPYFPDYGSSGYDALKYVIDLDWDPRTETLSGTTTIAARATQPLAAVWVDLALEATSAEVNGRSATHQRSGFQDLQIVPETQIPTGAEFEIKINYSGKPGEIKRNKIAPWSATNQEWLVAGEPESSAWWFPANDHPSDPALMDVSVRVPAGLEAISVGRLESADSQQEQDFDTWHWIASQPMATYLNFLAIGQFQVDQGLVDGRPYVYAVSEQLTPEERTRALEQLRKSGAIIRELEGWFGPYPFTEVGGIVPAAPLWFSGLETQTRPVYERQSILSSGFAETLLAHELAHMWFGDNVTLRRWDDIFTNEAYATWAQWASNQQRGGPTLNERLEKAYAATKEDPRFWRITMIDPGQDQLFATVYERGPMTLQALRNVIGEQAFNDLARDWAQKPGTRSLEEWMVTAQSKTSVDLVPFFQAWIFGQNPPEHTKANGFTD